MRTKTLLIAAAALAAGLVASQAQTVYSANIVGYVSVAAPAGQFVMIANPLTTGNDVLTNIISGAPGASSVQIWNGAGFNTYTYSGLTHHWTSGSNNGDNTPLPPGVGFFIKASANFTNTFVGSVAAASGGGTATNALTTGFSAVGSVIPYADVVTNSATINLQVAGASQIEEWNVSAQQFEPTFTYSALSHVWKQGTTVTNPVINVGEGFFISPSSATNWVETLQ
jgi:hypothetical protein